MALRRGESEGFLRVTLEIDRDACLVAMRPRTPLRARAALASEMELALADAYDRLLKPSIEVDVRPPAFLRALPNQRNGAACEAQDCLRTRFLGGLARRDAVAVPVMLLKPTALPTPCDVERVDPFVWNAHVPLFQYGGLWLLEWDHHFGRCD